MGARPVSRCRGTSRRGAGRPIVAGVTVVPDTKDWTWVLRRVCPECGFDARGFPRADIVGMIYRSAGAWRDVLAGPSQDVRRRPLPGVWSPLEYACHVRDVLRVYDERLRLMLTLDDPDYPNWDQDATAIAEHYGEQDPGDVAAELTAAAQAVATRFASVSDDQWERTGNRSDGARFTVETFARYFIHDPVHHLYDVTRGAHDRP
jgi:hypothetical protein